MRYLPILFVILLRTVLRVPLKNNHFLLSKSLPQHYLLPVVLTWDGGIYELLCQQKFQNACMARLAPTPLTFEGGRWRQRIRDFYGHEQGLVLPVLKELGPTDDETEAAIHVLPLLNGRTLRFAARPDWAHLSEEAWLARQAAGGNRFYDAVEREWWTPRPKHQRELNNLRPLVERNRALEKENAALKRKYDPLASGGGGGEEEEERPGPKTRRPCERLQTNLQALCEENQRLHHTLHGLIDEEWERLRKAHARLEQSHRVLEHTLTRLEEENTLLKLKILDMERKRVESPPQKK